MNRSRTLTSILLIAYIAIEVAFRSEMVSYVSSVMHYSEVYFVEFTGRFIASIGFSIFVYQFLSKEQTKLKKAAIITAAFLSFFTVEKVAIETIASSMSDENKARAVLLVNYKESVILGLKDNESIDIKDQSPASKTRIAFLPFANFSNEDLIRSLKASSAKDIAAVFNAKNLRFYELNTYSFKKPLETMNDIYNKSFDTQLAAVLYIRNNQSALASAWPYLSSRVKTRYTVWHGGTSNPKYPTLDKYLSSPLARDYMVKKTGIAAEQRACVVNKPWVATDMNGLVKAVKQCISEAFVAEIEKRLAEDGVAFKSGNQPDIFLKNFESLYSQPYFKDLVDGLAPFMKKPQGGMYSQERLADKNFVRSISGALAEVQMRNLKKIMDDPSSAKGNERNTMLLDSYAKAMIIPPFMIILSTIMIIVNVIKFGFSASSAVYSGKVKLAMSAILTLWVVLLPIVFMDGGKLKHEGEVVHYVRVWSENTSEALFMVDHKDQPFRAALSAITAINVIVQDMNIPILSSGISDDYSYRMAVSIRMKDAGLL